MIFYGNYQGCENIINALKISKIYTYKKVLKYKIKVLKDLKIRNYKYS